jgi:O-antigen/teichoic acid export membrane protein
MGIQNLINFGKKGMVRDSTLNIISSIVFIIATQILAYPYLSRIMTNSQYGIILTMMGIVNAIGGALGNALDNTRVLLQEEYDKRNLIGDYNVLFIICLFINIIVVALFSSLFLPFDTLTNIGCICISILILFRSYFTVSYRLVIDYKKYLYTSIFGLLGYVIGIVLTHFTGMWLLTFLIGELLSCIYVFFTAAIIHDKFKITALFSVSMKKYSFILAAAIISAMMTYMDRFFIYPMLGSEQVSIYNVASFLGKMVGIVINPISGVLLTYYAKETKLTISQFFRRLILFIIISFLFYSLILLFGLPITGILYPTIVDRASPIFAIANLATTVFIIGNTIQPTLLRFCSVRWQPVIQGVYLILYIVLGIVGMKGYGLIGFCYSVLISNLVKIIMMVVIAIVSLKKEVIL